jgi:hypothetical protein
MFAWYLETGATVHSIALRLTHMGIPTPTGKPRWNVASVRGILKNPAYTGTAYGNRTRIVEATQRKSALLPVGPGVSYRYRLPVSSARGVDRGARAGAGLSRDL